MNNGVGEYSSSCSMNIRNKANTNTNIRIMIQTRTFTITIYTGVWSGLVPTALATAHLCINWSETVQLLQLVYVHVRQERPS